jgi:hypothetical protein
MLKLSVLVSPKMVLQVAVTDIGQLTDFEPCLQAKAFVAS